MTQLPPTIAHELEEYDTWDPADTMTTADLEPDDVCEATVERTGEPCGRELPCPYHD